MLVAGMIENHIHDYLDAALVSQFHQLAILLVRTQTGIDGVMISDGVAVIAFVGLIVFQHRI